MKKHTVTVVRLSDLSTKTFKVTHFRMGQRSAWGRDEWGTRYSWPLSEFIVRAH